MSERLGAYDLHERLGQGGMAVVFRGERVGEAGFKKKVAIKRILPQYRRDPALLERFAAEARTAARLDHPNLVQVLDFGIDPEPYLVLEYVEGVSLSQVMQRLLTRHETLEMAAVLFVAAEVANGLDHAHRKRGDDGTPLGIVHRDVSPQNVLLSNEGAVKVSDFGLVKAADNVLKTASGITIGKLSYMAPEQADGRDVDARADLFALGVTIWEMLTLRSLIPPDDPERAARMLQLGGFDPPSRFRPDTPSRVDALVLACLAIDREARMPSAQQLAAELREILHERVAGYDRQQLARMLQWLFPEKGWVLPEPDRPAAQPSPEERASMMPVTPALVAIARMAETEAESAPSDDDAPTAVPPTRPPSAAAQPAVPAPAVPAPVVLGPGALGPGALGPGVGPPIAASLPVAPPVASVPVAAPSRTPRWVWWIVAPVVALSLSFGVAGILALGVTGWHLAANAPPTLHLRSVTPGVRFYLGPAELGEVPQDITQDRLVGQPIIAVAPGHEPRVLQAARIAELLAHGDHEEHLDLAPSTLPSTILYVRYEGQGTAYSNEGFGALGSVPGALRIVNGSGANLTIIDDVSGQRVELAWQPCQLGTLCVLDAR